MTSYIRDIGPTLVNNGYPVIELVPGKKCPTRKQWQTNPLSAQACRQHDPTGGVGILCGYGEHPICAVDVDFCGTQQEADALFEALCDAYPDCRLAVYRVGRAPKFALLFRAETAWTKQVTQFFMKDGDPKTKSRLEVLGRGQQIALYHTHPSTGLPYTYPYDVLSGTPVDVLVEDLPLMTYKGVQDLCEAFSQFMLDNGWGADLTSSQRLAITAEEDDFTRCMPKKRVGLSINEIRQLMKKRTASWGDYNQWFQDGMRIHHETSGSPEGLVLWDELSQLAPGYDGFETVERKWNSFSDKGQDATTMWPIARSEGLIVGQATELSESGLACRFIRDYGDYLRYSPNSKKWYHFDAEDGQWVRLGQKGTICSRFWRQVLIKTLNSEIAEAKDEGNEERAKLVLKYQKRCLDNLSSVQDKVMKVLSGLEELYADEEEMDSLDGYIGVRNGLVNVATRDLIPNRPDALMVKQCSVDFEPSADCPTWRKCVEDWFETPDVARYMQKVLGKMLLGKPDEEAFYLLVGAGANGKSSFLETISGVLGDYSRAVGEETIVGKGGLIGGGHRADIVRLRGARFVYCSETTNGESFRASELKRISGGDKIAARGAYAAEMQEFKAQFILFIATNFAPNMQGADDAMRRRIRLIRFPHNFESPKFASKRVQGLSHMLENERSGILNWMLEGYELAKREGMAVPKEVIAATKEYVDSHDLVTMWFEETCEEGEPREGEKAPVTKELFEAYRTWLESMNEPTKFERQRGFIDRLKKVLDRKGIEYALKRSNGVSRIRGIRFIDKSALDSLDDDFD